MKKFTLNQPNNNMYKPVPITTAFLNFFVLTSVEFSAYPDHFVQKTDAGECLRSKCVFKRDESVSGGAIILFHLSGGEIDDFNRKTVQGSPVFLYGTKGQVNVLQIRCSGQIREMTEVEKAEFIDSLESGFNLETIGYRHSDPKKLIVDVSIDSGGLFLAFEISDYAQRWYERG